MQEESALQVIEIGDGKTIVTNIDLNGKFPLVIGRGPDADIQIGSLGKRTLVSDQHGNFVPIAKYISSVQATIHRYENGELRIHDGNCKPSANGIRIFGQQDPIKRPVPLSPGAHVELAPRKKGFGCWVEWADTSANNEPTLGFNRWNKALLEDDKRALEGEKKELLERVRAVEIVNETQDVQIRLTRQKIDRVKMLGMVAVVALLISLPIDIDQLEDVLKVVAIAAGSGLVWTAAEKSQGG